MNIVNEEVPVEVRRRIGVHAETPSGRRAAALVFGHQAKEPDVFPDGADQCRVLTPPVSGGKPVRTATASAKYERTAFLSGEYSTTTTASSDSASN